MTTWFWVEQVGQRGAIYQTTDLLRGTINAQVREWFKRAKPGDMMQIETKKGLTTVIALDNGDTIQHFREVMLFN